MIEYTTGLVGLQDKFDWRLKKLGSLQLSDIYAYLDNAKYAERAKTCATWLQFKANSVTGKKKLAHANFCQLRLCPLCTTRRAMKMALGLSKVCNRVDTDDYEFLFLTLTTENCQGKDLRKTCQLLTKAWKKLREQRRPERIIKGYFRATEITYNAKEKTYHPHLHIILVVPKGYAKHKKADDYIPHAEWLDRWTRCLKADKPQGVHIQKVKGKGGSVNKAVLEAAKYTTKSNEYIHPALRMEDAAQRVHDYTIALRGLRMSDYGLLLRDIADGLGVDEDDDNLLHLDDDTVRDDIYDLMVTYDWHFGVGDYVLMDVAPYVDEG